mmetsp:Transcript_27707/g.70638  ORF Transcript_27707/g.70638 Transcript_27707/m.70638 type:complete len:276 (+) Transcript_27707:1-828(+)
MTRGQRTHRHTHMKPGPTHPRQAPRSLTHQPPRLAPGMPQRREGRLAAPTPTLTPNPAAPHATIGPRLPRTHTPPTMQAGRKQAGGTPSCLASCERPGTVGGSPPQSCFLARGASVRPSRNASFLGCQTATSSLFPRTVQTNGSLRPIDSRARPLDRRRGRPDPRACVAQRRRPRLGEYCSKAHQGCRVQGPKRSHCRCGAQSLASPREDAHGGAQERTRRRPRRGHPCAATTHRPAEVDRGGGRNHLEGSGSGRQAVACYRQAPATPPRLGQAA